MRVRPPTPEGLKPKDLIGVPWRLAFALQEAGWWLRSEVIWHKPNAHPESVSDRPTKAHETLFLLSKRKDYYYDKEAVKGPHDRRLRTVWEIPTEPMRRANGSADDHPADADVSARRCVSITSERGSVVLDPYAGAGTTLLAARTRTQLGRGSDQACICGSANDGWVDSDPRRTQGDARHILAVKIEFVARVTSPWPIRQTPISRSAGRGSQGPRNGSNTSACSWLCPSTTALPQSLSV